MRFEQVIRNASLLTSQVRPKSARMPPIHEYWSMAVRPLKKITQRGNVPSGDQFGGRCGGSCRHHSKSTALAIVSSPISNTIEWKRTVKNLWKALNERSLGQSLSSVCQAWSSSSKMGR